MTTRHVAAGLAAAAVLLAACGGGGDEADETTTTRATTTSTTSTTTTTTVEPTTTTRDATTTTTVPAIPRQPLTGDPLESEDDVIDRPALAVKIDNAPASRRNHVGLGNADIVFEEIVEGSITRFAAIFHTRDSDPVGPIRSGRSQDVDLLSSFNSPLFAWSGGNPGVTRLIADSFLTDLNWQKNTGSYYRGPGPTPHNLYSSTERLWALTPADHPGPPVQQYAYLDDDEAFEGEEVDGFDLRLRGIDVEWDWDEDSGTFLRSQEGGPHNDVQHGRIDAINVVVMIVEYRPSQIDARSPEAQTLGDGPVYVFSDGQVVEGRWSRAVSIFPIEFTDLDGEPLELQVGNTWIELAEANPTDDLANPTTDIEIDYVTPPVEEPTSEDEAGDVES